MIKTTQKWKIGNCLELLPEIKDKSIDMILCDLPYGTTACRWDVIIPFEPLWKEYERIIKDNGAILLTSSQPFTSKLVMSNIKLFRYEWVWEKTLASNFMNVKTQPAKIHENILVFYKNTPKYNPQKTIAPHNKIDKRKTLNNCKLPESGIFGDVTAIRKKDDGTRYPKSIIIFHNPNNQTVHPTQKPVKLFEYLIKTYTDEGDTIHDSCLGSGTTLEACRNTNRNCVGFEISHEWEDVYKKRLETQNKRISDF